MHSLIYPLFPALLCSTFLPPFSSSQKLMNSLTLTHARTHTHQGSKKAVQMLAFVSFPVFTCRKWFSENTAACSWAEGTFAKMHYFNNRLWVKERARNSLSFVLSGLDSSPKAAEHAHGQQTEVTLGLLFWTTEAFQLVCQMFSLTSNVTVTFTP